MHVTLCYCGFLRHLILITHQYVHYKNLNNKTYLSLTKYYSLFKDNLISNYILLVIINYLNFA